MDQSTSQAGPPRRPIVRRDLGDPGRFSSAGTFSLPVGSHLRPDRLGGYYIDFSVKAGTPRWPPEWLDPPEQIHVVTAQWGLGCYERYLGERARSGRRRGEPPITCSREQERGGPLRRGLVPRQAKSHTYRLTPPWLSAMAQGEGASLLVRANAATDDDRFAEAARRALGPLAVPTAEGGVRPARRRLLPRGVSDGSPVAVLNGGIFAFWGYRDVAIALGDSQVDAPELSPTFTWTSESMPLAASSPPIHAELESMIWPSSSSVPTASTSQRSVISRLVDRERLQRLGQWRARTRYCAPLMRASTTAIHSKPFHSHVASSAVSGIRAKPTASCWNTVLYFAILYAGTLMPLPPTNTR